MLHRRQVLAVALVLVTVVVLTVALYWYNSLLSPRKPAWLELGSSMVYEQAFACSGHHETKNMSWEIVRLEDNIVNVHLISHGVDTSS